MVTQGLLFLNVFVQRSRATRSILGYSITNYRNHWATEYGNILKGQMKAMASEKFQASSVPFQDLIMHFGKNVGPNRHLCTMSIACVLADDKMANISLDVHTFIAQNLPKGNFQSSLDYTFLSLSESSIIF